jgi:hypothetical protein
MKKAACKYLTRFLRFVTSHVKEMVISSIFSSIIATIYYYFLQTPVNDARGWILAFGRVLQDGFRSGFMRGTPFKDAQGNWAVAWRLGGAPPFIHTVILYVFLGISIFGITSCSVYALRKYHSFGRLKGIWTYRGRPKSFWSYISAGIVVALVTVSLVGITGTMVNPNLIVPAEPSKNYLGFETRVSATLYVTVIHHAIVRVEPTVLKKDNVTGWLDCIITSPGSEVWKPGDIDASTILLNNVTRPSSVTCHSESNYAASILAQFDKKLLNYLFEGTGFLEQGIVTLNLNGRLKNGDYFSGNTQLRIEV